MQLNIIFKFKNTFYFQAKVLHNWNVEIKINEYNNKWDIAESFFIITINTLGSTFLS